MIFVFIAIFFFLTLAGFFSASETALTVISKARIHKLAKKDNASAAVVVQLLNRTEHAISSLLIGTALIHMIIMSLIGSWTSHLFAPSMQALIIFGSSTFIIVFCDMLPKMFALNYPEPILLRFPHFLKFMVFICTPINTVVKGIARLLLKLMRLDEGKKKEDIDELKGYIDLHYNLSLKRNSEERTMLRSVLDLDCMRVQDAMVHRSAVQMIEASTPLDVILETIQNSPFTRMPVYKEDPDNIVGILNVRSFLRYCFQAEKPDQFNLLSLIAKPWFIPNHTDLLGQLRAFRQEDVGSIVDEYGAISNRQERLHLAVIVDEYGVSMGIITLEDILEEIVGDITDEYDIKPGHVVRSPDGSFFLVSGSYSVRDFNRRFDLELSAEHAITLSGLIMDTAQKIPDVGERFVIQGVTFEIIKTTTHFILTVKVILPEIDPTAAVPSEE